MKRHGTSSPCKNAKRRAFGQTEPNSSSSTKSQIKDEPEDEPETSIDQSSGEPVNGEGLLLSPPAQPPLLLSSIKREEDERLSGPNGSTFRLPLRATQTVGSDENVSLLEIRPYLARRFGLDTKVLVPPQCINLEKEELENPVDNSNVLTVASNVTIPSSSKPSIAPLVDEKEDEALDEAEDEVEELAEELAEYQEEELTEEQAEAQATDRAAGLSSNAPIQSGSSKQRRNLRQPDGRPPIDIEIESSDSDEEDTMALAMGLMLSRALPEEPVARRIGIAIQTCSRSEPIGPSNHQNIPSFSFSSPVFDGLGSLYADTVRLRVPKQPSSVGIPFNTEVCTESLANLNPTVAPIITELQVYSPDTISLNSNPGPLSLAAQALANQPANTSSGRSLSGIPMPKRHLNGTLCSLNEHEYTELDSLGPHSTIEEVEAVGLKHMKESLGLSNSGDIQMTFYQYAAKCLSSRPSPQATRQAPEKKEPPKQVASNPGPSNTQQPKPGPSKVVAPNPAPPKPIEANAPVVAVIPSVGSAFEPVVKVVKVLSSKAPLHPSKLSKSTEPFTSKWPNLGRSNGGRTHAGHPRLSLSGKAKTSGQIGLDRLAQNIALAEELRPTVQSIIMQTRARQPNGGSGAIDAQSRELEIRQALRSVVRQCFVMVPNSEPQYSGRTDPSINLNMAPKLTEDKEELIEKPNKFALWLYRNRVKQESIDRSELCFINQMPNEMFMIVFENLPLRDLIRLPIVCHRWVQLLRDAMAKYTKLTLFTPEFSWVHGDFYQLQFFPPIGLCLNYREADSALVCRKMTWQRVNLLKNTFPGLTELSILNVEVEDRQMFQLVRAFKLTKFVFCPSPVNGPTPFCWYNFWCHFQTVQAATIESIAILNARSPLLNLSGDLPQLRSLCVDLSNNTGRVSLGDVFNQFKKANKLESLCFRNIQLSTFMSDFRELLTAEPELDLLLQQRVHHFVWEGDSGKANSRVHIPAVVYFRTRFPNLTHLELSLCFDIKFSFLVRKLRSLVKLEGLRLTSANTRTEREGFFDIQPYADRNFVEIIDTIPSLRSLQLNIINEPVIYFYQLVLAKAFPNLVELSFQSTGRVYKPCRCKAKLSFEYTALQVGETYKCVNCPVVIAVAFVRNFPHLQYVYRHNRLVFDRRKHKLGDLRHFRTCLEENGQFIYTHAV